MTKKISIINYGVGNILSIKNAISHLGFDALLTSNKDEILSSTHVILPGVGSFPSAMQKIKDLKLINTLDEVSKKGVFILGICLGMQILFNNSYEIKKTEGLRLLDGEVKKLNNNQKKTIIKLPHIGWNNLNISESDPILKNITKKDYFYFIHNYAVCNTGEEVKFTTTTYEQINFPALTWKKNIYGCQFHPEKSATSGLKLLENFINLN